MGSEQVGIRWVAVYLMRATFGQGWSCSACRSESATPAAGRAGADCRRRSSNKSGKGALHLGLAVPLALEAGVRAALPVRKGKAEPS